MRSIFRLVVVSMALGLTQVSIAPAASADGDTQEDEHEAENGGGPQTYQVGIAETSFVDFKGVPITASVYYPSAKANGRPLRNHDKFAGMVFLQGFGVPAEQYTWVSNIAANGYIVILPDRPPAEIDVPGGPPVTAIVSSVDVMNQSIEILARWNEQPSSPIYGRLEPKVAVAGHSAGGLVAFIGMDPNGCLGHPLDYVLGGCPPGYAPHPLLKAGISIAGVHVALDPDPTSPLLKPFPSFPVYLIGGGNDVITPAIMQATYNRFADPKYYFNIEGGNHSGFTVSEDFTFDGVATIPRAEQLAITENAVTTFLDCVFGGKRRACKRIPTSPVAP